MNLFVSLEHRFMKCRGAFYDNSVYGRSFWQPYLEVFDRVTVVARAREFQQVAPDFKRVDDDGISFFEIPDFSRSLQSLRRIGPLVRAAQEVARLADIFLLRAPCYFGSLVWWFYRRRQHPFGVELLGDIYDVYQGQSWPARMFAAHIMVPLVQYQCREARVASYVTSQYLQRRYPPGPDTQHFAWSDNLLEAADLHSYPRHYGAARRTIRLVYTAGFNPYKGHMQLLQVLMKATEMGLNWHMTLIGDGICKDDIQMKAAALGMTGRLRFAGAVSNSKVLELLEEADIYVTTSLTEGLPRAVIEAQAKALPVVGFSVGGIPEIVPSCSLVPVNDIEGLAERLVRLAMSPADLMFASEQSLNTARLYLGEKQRILRLQSYRALKEMTHASHR